MWSCICLEWPVNASLFCCSLIGIIYITAVVLEATECKHSSIKDLLYSQESTTYIILIPPDICELCFTASSHPSSPPSPPPPTSPCPCSSPYWANTRLHPVSTTKHECIQPVWDSLLQTTNDDEWGCPSSSPLYPSPASAATCSAGISFKQQV